MDSDAMRFCAVRYVAVRSTLVGARSGSVLDGATFGRNWGRVAEGRIGIRIGIGIELGLRLGFENE